MKNIELDVLRKCAKNLHEEKELAKQKALDNLARYKFANFGYWSSIWVHLNKLDGNEPNPFRPLIELARDMAHRRGVGP